VDRWPSFTPSLVIVMLVSACATTQGPPAPVEVPPGRIGVVVVGPPKEPSPPITAAEAAAAVGLFTAVTPPLFYITAPLWAYGAGKCAGEIYKAHPELNTRFKEAVAREFSRDSLRTRFVEEMKVRTTFEVIPFGGVAGVVHLGHATALTEAASHGVHVLVELIEPQVGLGASVPVLDNCHHTFLYVTLTVQATPLNEKKAIYSESVRAVCTSFVSFDTVGLWLNQEGALREELEPCYAKLASLAFDYDSNPYTHRPQLKLPGSPATTGVETVRDTSRPQLQRPETADGFVAPDSGPLVADTRPRYDLPATSMLLKSKAPAYASKILGEWVLVHDESIRKAAANIDANGDLRTYWVALEPSLTGHLRHTIDPLFQEIHREAEMPSADVMAQTGATGVIVVRLDELSISWECSEGTYTASSTVTLGLDVRFADGRPLAAAMGHSVTQSHGVGRSGKECSAEQVKPFVADAVHRSLDKGLRDIAQRVASEAGLHEK
jgi:hypothetical protein